jgi:tetratricopeptide (TPR) repeat protein
VISRRPLWGAGFRLRGQLAEQDGRSGEQDALRDFQRAIDLGSDDPGLVRHVFVMVNQQQRFDEADDLVRKLEDRGGAPAELKLAAALSLLRRNEFDRAVAQAREILSENSSSASDLLLLCHVLLDAGHVAEIEKPLKRAEELASGTPDLWITKVKFLLASGRKAEVPQAIEQAGKALPRPQASRTIAHCQSLAGNDTEAEALLADALKQAPADPQTLRLAAEFYVKVFKLDRAEPLIARLRDPLTGASPANLAWANRAHALGLVATGRPEKLEEALTLVNENLKDNPYSLDDQRAQGTLLALIPNQRGEAIKVLTRLNLSGLLTRENRFELAKLHAKNQKWALCRDLMKGLLGEQSPSSRHLAFYANLLFDRDLPDEVERCLQRFKPSPTDKQADLVLTTLSARLLQVRKRDAEIGGLLGAFAARHPERPVDAADQFERYGMFAAAEKAYRGWLAQNPADPARSLVLAAFLGRGDRTAEALELIEQARKQSPPEPAAAALVGVLAAAKNVTEAQWGHAEAWLRQALRAQSASSPVSTTLRLKLASVRSLQRHYEDEEALYREVLAGNPDNLEALNNLAWLLALRPGAQQEAYTLVTKAIELAGTDATLLDTRAVILLQRGQKDDAAEAIKTLTTAIGLNPRKSVLYFHLARAHRQNNDIEGARNALRAAEQRGLKPESIDPRERDAFLKVRQELSLS